MIPGIYKTCRYVCERQGEREGERQRQRQTDRMRQREGGGKREVEGWRDRNDVSLSVSVGRRDAQGRMLRQALDMR